MNRTNAKRLLSLLLSLAMICVFVCVPVSAEDTTAIISEPEEIDEVEVEDVEDADDAEEIVVDEEDSLVEDDYANANYGIATIDDTEGETGTSTVVKLPESVNGEIKLEDDYALTGQYVLESGSVTIDLNGHSITRGEGNSFNYLIVVNSGATLTIKDSNAGENTIAGGVYAYGTLNIEGGTIAPPTDWGVKVDGSTVTISGGTIRATYGVVVSSGSLEVKDSATISGSNRAVDVGGGTATISGGTLSGQYAVMNFGGTLTVSGGTITGTHSGVYVNDSSATTTITGGTISAKYSVNVLAGTLEIDGENISIGGTYGVWCQGASVSATIKSGKIAADTGGVMVFSGANVTIGTEGSESGPEISGSYEAVEISTSASATAPAVVTIYSGTLSGTSYGICIYGKNSDEKCYSQLNIYGGSITATNYFAITGNGSTGQGYDTIYIYGGTIKSENGQAIYHPQQEGTMYVYGGTITGDTGIEVRGGTVVIDDDEDDTADLIIKATGTPTDSEGNYSGSTTSGAAVAIAPYDNHALNVTINSGTLIGASAVYESNPNETALTNSVTISMTGGTYDGAVTVQDADEKNVTVTVTGGTYSTDVSDYTTTTSTAVATTGEDGNTVYTVITTVDGAVALIFDSNGNYSNSYTSLAAAIDAVASGQTVKLVKNVELTDTLKIYKSITLDLGDYTITSSASEKAVYTTQTLTVTAGKGGIEATNGNAINNQKGSGTGTLTIDGGTYTSSANHAIYNNNGTVTVNSGTIKTTASSKDAICCYADATVTVNGGELTGTRYGIYSTSAVTITDGTIYGEKAGVYLNGGKAEISGGTIKGAEGLKGTSSVTSLNITGGTFEGETHGVYVCNEGVTVSGGTFKATGTKDQYAVAFYIDGAKVTFSGGTFSGMYSTAWIKSGSNGEITIANGYMVNTGTLTDNNSSDTDLLERSIVKAAASVTVSGQTTSYATLQAAVEAAGTTEATVTLLTDVTEDVVVEKGQTITLDLNGCKITNSESHTITNYGTLTITDSTASESGCGTVDNVTHACAAVYNEMDAVCTILAGNFTRSKEASTSSSNNGGNSYYTILNHGTMTIGSKDGNNYISVSNNGLFSSMIENGWQNGAQNTNGNNSTMYIYGGSFTGGLYNVKNDDYGVLCIYGGTFKGTNNVLSWNVLTITGGDFTSTNMGVYTGYGDATMDKGTTTITGGNFTSSGRILNVYNTGASYAVSGGTYSQEVKPEYCADGYTPTANANNTYGVELFNIGISTDTEGAEESVPATIMSASDGVMYVKVSADNIGKYDESAYPTTKLTFIQTNDDNTTEEHNYIFAGWYSATDGTSAYTSIPKSDAYAKFVDENVLSVQCVITKGLTTDDANTNYWRFATTVDSLKYGSIGFKVYAANGAEVEMTTKITVYYKLTVSSAGDKVIEPNDFSNTSQYVASGYYADTTSATTFKAQAYWETLDGTTVYGQETTFVYADNFYTSATTEE